MAKLTLSSPDQHEKEFSLPSGSVTIGRGATNDIVIHDPKVSRLHARIECGADGCAVIDQGSGNGTLVNGVKAPRATLKPGDVLTLGNSTLRFDTGPMATEQDWAEIRSTADLDATLLQTAVPIALADIHTPHLVVHAGEKTWKVTFDQDALTIGRSEENNISLDFPAVSRRHAIVERRGDGFILRDLNSRNGTWAGGRRIEGEYKLQNGDTIRVGPAQLVFKGAFDSEDLTIVETPKGLARRRPPIVIVPGLFGSDLWQGNTRVWPNARAMFTNPELFMLPAKDPLRVGNIVGEVVIVPGLIKLDQYRRLGDFLQEAMGYQRETDLFEFGYDWRQDVRESARQLAAAIERWGLKPPIVLVGHSLGCMVSRYYVERLGGKDKVSRLFVMAGGHSGVPFSVGAMMPGSNLLPFGLLGDRFRSVLRSFPSLYQILPTNACVVNQSGEPMLLLQDATWLPDERRPLWQLARDFWDEVGASSSVPTVSVFGYGIKTATRARVELDGEGIGRKAELTFDLSGDDSIPTTSTVLKGTEIHPVLQHHGSLYVDNDVKMRLKVELLKDTLA